MQKNSFQFSKWGARRDWNERENSLFEAKGKKKTRPDSHNKEGVIKAGSGGTTSLF
jgi:hypothetical protein